MVKDDNNLNKKKFKKNKILNLKDVYNSKYQIVTFSDKMK